MCKHRPDLHLDSRCAHLRRDFPEERSQHAEKGRRLCQGQSQVNVYFTFSEIFNFLSQDLQTFLGLLLRPQ